MLDVGVSSTPAPAATPRGARVMYSGDPSLLTPSITLLKSGSPLRVLALSTSSWPSALWSALNSTFPDRAHAVTALTAPGLVGAAACISLPPRLLASVDLFILEPGSESSAHYGEIINAAESLLRSALLGMARPSALMLVRDGATRTLTSPAPAISLLAQFYGVPIATGANLAEAAVSLLQQRASDRRWSPPAASWPMPSRRMAPDYLTPSWLRAPADGPCPSSTRAKLVCERWHTSGAPTTCGQRYWRESGGLKRVMAAAASSRTNASADNLGPCQQGQGKGKTCGKWSADQATSLLPPGLLSRTRSHEGSTSSWARVMAKLDAGQHVTIAVLGGSMSLPHSKNDGWPELVLSWMRRTWPRATVSLHNGAIGATGSTFFALCADSRLPPTADLIFLEHTLNDGEQTAVVDHESLRTRALVYEVLVRRLLRRSNPSPALLFVHWDRIGWCANLETNPTYTQRFTNGPLSSLRGVPWLATPQAAADLIARHYGIPSLAPRNALWHRDCEDLSFRGAFCDSGGIMGCGHLRPIGYEVIATVITTFLADATAKVRRKQQSGDDGMVPAPLLEEVARLSATSHGRCARGDDMRALKTKVVSGEWSFVKRDPRQPRDAPDKPGFLSLTAPSVLEMEVGAVRTGSLTIGFLRSYDERMGELKAECRSGCACNATVLNGHHARKSSVLVLGMLRVTPSEACTLRLTHRARRVGVLNSLLGDEKQTSSKFKLMAIIVPPWVIDASDRDMARASGFTS